MTSVSTPSVPHDQARTLRTMIGEAASRNDAAVSGSCHTIAVVSGKGGVGKSTIALNLAVSLAQQGQSVCLLDANLGLGNLDLMCGLNGYWNLSHVMTGARSLNDIVLRGPDGIDLIPGASGITELADCPAHAQQQLLEQLTSLEREHDVLIIDTGSGIHRLVRQFALSADQMLVVTTPEPTSITDAYATVKALCAAGVALGVVVNQSESEDIAHRIGARIRHTARLFLQADVDLLGSIPKDAAVPQSILARQPVVTCAPDTPAAEAISRLSQRCRSGRSTANMNESFFSRLSRGLLRAA